MSDDRQMILNAASDLAINFISYDRKEDEDLPRGVIEQAIALKSSPATGVQRLSIKEYADQKLVHVSELNEYFKIFSTTKEIDGDIEHCRKCGARGAKRTMLTKDSWTSAAYCSRCQSITLRIQGDHMSGNRNDTYIVYVSR